MAMGRFTGAVLVFTELSMSVLNKSGGQMFAETIK